MGFGSAAASGQATGFRCNSNRSGTSPAHDWANLPDSFGDAIRRIQGVVIENKSAVEVMLQHDGNDTLHYVDPPYPHETRSGKKRGDQVKGYRHEMDDDQHRALAGVLLELAGMVVLSGYACPLYDDELYADWGRVERPALADGARPRTEVLWMNALATERLERSQARLFA